MEETHLACSGTSMHIGTSGEEFIHVRRPVAGIRSIVEGSKTVTILRGMYMWVWG